MLKPIVWLFLFLAIIFATAHVLAVQASLYWYYDWFDIPMHLYGGILISLGVFSLTSFRSVRFEPTFFLTLGFLFTIMIAWEVFERFVGPYDSSTYIYDVSKDLLFGFIGGVLGYKIISKLRK